MYKNKKRKLLYAHSAMIIAILIWGSTYFIIKDSLQGIHPVTLVFYRFLIATILLSLVLIVVKKNPFQHIHRGLHLGLILWMLYIPQTIGLVYVSASNSGFMTSLYILIIPIASALFLKSKITKQRIISIIIALVGLYCVTGGIDKIGLGDTFTLFAAFAIATQYLLVDYYLKNKADPIILCFQQFLFLTIATFITMQLIHAPLTINSSQALIDMLYLAVFPSVIAYILQTNAQRYITPMTISIFGVLEPISAAIFAWTLGGEHMQPVKALGGMLIVIAIIIAEIQLKNVSAKFS